MTDPQFLRHVRVDFYPAIPTRMDMGRHVLKKPRHVRPNPAPDSKQFVGLQYERIVLRFVLELIQQEARVEQMVQAFRIPNPQRVEELPARFRSGVSRAA